MHSIAIHNAYNWRCFVVIFTLYRASFFFLFGDNFFFFFLPVIRSDSDFFSYFCCFLAFSPHFARRSNDIFCVCILNRFVVMVRPIPRTSIPYTDGNKYLRVCVWNNINTIIVFVYGFLLGVNFCPIIIWILCFFFCFAISLLLLYRLVFVEVVCWYRLIDITQNATHTHTHKTFRFNQPKCQFG